MRPSIVVFVAAVLFAGCGLFGLDTPGERAEWTQLTQDEAREQANRDAQAAADKAKTEAETKAAEVAADVLRKAEVGHDPVDLRMAARQLGFNKETHREYVNDALTKDVSSIVGKWKTASGSDFEFDREFCGIGSDSSCVPGTSLDVKFKGEWREIDFDNEPDFAAFIRDCQAVDEAWKALK